MTPFPPTHCEAPTWSQRADSQHGCVLVQLSCCGLPQHLPPCMEDVLCCHCPVAQMCCPPAVAGACCVLVHALQDLQLVACRNVRNRDLYVLANNNLHLTSLVLGDDTNKPWVTNRCVLG